MVGSFLSFMIARMICSIGVIPERERQVNGARMQRNKKKVQVGMWEKIWTNTSTSCQKPRMNLYIYVPVPPAIIPTYFTFLVTGSAFFSGRIANSPEKRERDGKQWRKQGKRPIMPIQHVQLIDFVSALSPFPLHNARAGLRQRWRLHKLKQMLKDDYSL